MSDNLKYVDVSIVSIYNYKDNVDDVTVAIGDGTVKFDDDYEYYDARVYFYFDNQAQFDRARVEALEEVGFKITKILDE
jgi:hypothetical protein